MPCFCIGLGACAAAAAAASLSGAVSYYFYDSIETIKEDCYEPELIIDCIDKYKD